jgi:oligopeptide/dipeptide ABC transporter ATP-binding protein
MSVNVGLNGAAKELVRVDNLTKHFPVGGGFWGKSKGLIRAVDGVSFAVQTAETLGLVGESGSGKSTIGRLLLRLQEPTGGSVRFEGEDIYTLKGDGLRNLRQKVQIVFQDPYSSLNPRMTVGRILLEGLEPLHLPSRAEQEAEIDRLLELVGLRSTHKDRYPHEFSGGQRQRIGIARALAVRPRFLVADEPVSALDVSIQAQVLNLLLELQQTLGLTVLFIAHDLAVVRHMSDRIAVMYLGKIVELANSADIYTNPRHPYTRTLLAAIPIPDPNRRSLPLNVPAASGSQAETRGGCVFRPRCPYATEQCAQEPPLIQIATGHVAACHFANSLPDYP